MAEPLHLRVDRLSAGGAVLRVGGEIDHDSVEALTEACLRLIAAGHRHVVLDLAGVGFCDSSGLNCMIKVFQAAAAVHGSLGLTEVPPRLHRLLTITGVDQLIPTYGSVESALDAVGVLPDGSR